MMVIPNHGRLVAVISAVALAGGLLTLAVLAKPTQAQPPTDEENGAVSEQLPVEFTIDASRCAGELIDVTGTLHTVNHFRGELDPQGNPVGTYHVNSHFNLQNVKGVGQTTGEKYVIPASGAAVENSVADGQIVTGTVDINLVVGKGQIPNQVAFSRVHFIIDDGEVKVENIQFHFKCQPGNASPTATASATAAANATAATASPTATDSPGTGGSPLAMGAAVLLVGAGLAARRLF